MQVNGHEKFILLGASRGLGKAFANHVLQQQQISILNFSRKENSWDFSKQENYESYLKQLHEMDPGRLFYFAGGGPYGDFQDKEWKDHDWALKVNFLFPAQLLHSLLKNKPGNLKQIIFIGSSVAEAQPDPQASSYAAAKHALKGLITTVQKEASANAQKQSSGLKSQNIDIRLFSPGYMDTELLPAHAWPRQEGLAKKPEEIAQTLYTWIQNKDDAFTHLIL